MARMTPPDYRAVAQAKPLCDEIGREKIAEVVHLFYDVLRAHPRLKQFLDVINDWPR